MGRNTPSTVGADLQSLAKEWESLHAERPPMLYHYTTAAGLIGIVGSQRLWATNARFLNDPSEIRYALRVISDTVGEMEKAYLEACRAEPTLSHFPDMASALLNLKAPRIELWAKDLLKAFDQQREVEEAEWRVIQFGLDAPLVKFRTSGGGIVPYVELDLTAETSDRPRLPIRTITYGPTLEPAVSERALKMLCSTAGYSDSEVIVRQSSIPFRGPG